MTHDLRIHAADEPRPVRGEFVLYWMQGVAMRGRDNPALDFAAEQANRLGLPLLVYQGLRPDYPWASDRIHTFILESAVNLGAELGERGIQYAFCLEHAPLVQLAARAALVVTEFFPTFIMPRQTRALRAKVAAPVVAVDASTVVPLRYHGRAHATAASFRRQVVRALPAFLKPAPPVEPVVRRAVEMPFEPVDLARASISALVAAAAMDHSVPPSRSFRGGSAAARMRLDRFLIHGLPRYDQRQDPNAEATSGLSPYLHFGCIGPREVLLRARAAGPALQLEQFQDELLTWRELAFNFVFHDRRHRTVEAIPAWARAELAAHERDPRPVVYDLPTLEAAGTGDDLWNAAQRAYLVDGWMHNTLRMLWGKAVLGWTRNATECLAMLEHLNNKYALDGRDPNSYGGIHWIFGKFDRPFYRRPIYGTVRYQSLKAAAGKFDVAACIRRYPPASA